MMTEARVHGLDGGLTEPDWSPLTLDEVRALLCQFPSVGESVDILTVSPRPFAAASVIATTKGRVFVKRHPRAVRDKEGLREEHRFMAHLLQHGAPVARVLPTAKGETVIETEATTYEVHEAPRALDIYQDAASWSPFLSADHARSAGAALARLHLAAEGFDAPRRKPRPLIASFTIFSEQDAEAGMKRFLAERPAIAGDSEVRTACDEALELLGSFHQELLPLLPALPSLWTHNDFHASNLLWSAESNGPVVAAIDFGLADRTNPVHDIAHAIERNIVEWLVLVDDPDHPEKVPIHFHHLKQMLIGYESVRPLSDAEAAALAPMAALCHAEFALSESYYFLSILNSRCRARMAYNGWLVGHAQWFRSVRGYQLVTFLRQWAATHSSSSQKAADQ
jgi:Ser/Thr protein kinase RdoA (MazF antagonist)